MGVYPPLPVPLPTPLTPIQIQGAMQLLTANLLNLWSPPLIIPDQKSPIYSQVRVGWQTLGQPSEDVATDIAYIRCVEVDDEYNRTRDVATVANPADPEPLSPTTVLQVTTYIRVWKTFWVLIGPNSFDRTRQIKSGLFTQAIHDVFAVLGLQLYLVTDLEAARRVPEQRGSGQWWERVDFEAKFNELVFESVVIPLAASVEVIINDSASSELNTPLADFTVELGVPEQGGLGVGPLGGNPYGE